MAISEIKNTSARVFYGKYTELSILTTIFVLIILLKKITDLSVAYVMLSENLITVNELFIPQYLPWLIIQILTDAAEFIMLIPLKTSITELLYNTVGKNRLNVSKMPEIKVKLKLSVMWIIIKLIHFISFLPFIFSIHASIRFITKAYETSSGEGYIILSFYCFIFALFFLSRYFYVFTGTLLSPFIFMQNTDSGLIRIIIDSFRKMHGRRWEFIKLTAGFSLWGLLSIFIVTIPYVIARYLSWYSIFAYNTINNKKDNDYISCEIQNINTAERVL